MPGTPVVPWTATAFAVVILLSIGCSRTPRLDSQWQATSIQVDGADADWGDRRYVLETLNVTVAVSNDSNYLYLCVVTSDRSVQMQVVRRGIELWLDPKGGSKSYFGVRVPGVEFEGLRPSMGESGGQGNPGGRRRRGGGDGTGAGGPSPERLAQWLKSLEGPREIHILDAPHDEGWRTTPGASDPVQARLGFDQGRLVYEARVPLQYRGYPPLSLDGHVGLGLRLPAPERPPGGRSNPRGDFGGGRGGGGFGGPGGGGRGGGGRMGGERMGGGRGGMPGMSMETVEQWVRVELHAP